MCDWVYHFGYNKLLPLAREPMRRYVLILGPLQFFGTAMDHTIYKPVRVEFLSFHSHTYAAGMWGVQQFTESHNPHQIHVLPWWFAGLRINSVLVQLFTFLLYKKVSIKCVLSHLQQSTYCGYMFNELVLYPNLVQNHPIYMNCEFSHFILKW